MRAVVHMWAGSAVAGTPGGTRLTCPGMPCRPGRPGSSAPSFLHLGLPHPLSLAVSPIFNWFQAYYLPKFGAPIGVSLDRAISRPPAVVMLMSKTTVQPAELVSVYISLYAQPNRALGWSLGSSSLLSISSSLFALLWIGATVPN